MRGNHSFVVFYFNFFIVNAFVIFFWCYLAYQYYCHRRPYACAMLYVPPLPPRLLLTWPNLLYYYCCALLVLLSDFFHNRQTLLLRFCWRSQPGGVAFIVANASSPRWWWESGRCIHTQNRRWIPTTPLWYKKEVPTSTVVTMPFIATNNTISVYATNFFYLS